MLIYRKIMALIIWICGMLFLDYLIIEVIGFSGAIPMMCFGGIYGIIVTWLLLRWIDNYKKPCKKE